MSRYIIIQSVQLIPDQLLFKVAPTTIFVFLVILTARGHHHPPLTPLDPLRPGAIKRGSGDHKIASEWYAMHQLAPGNNG